MKSFAVIGLGLFGSCVARQVCALGGEVLAIDTSPELVQQISGEVTSAVVADAQDKDVLKALGAQDCDCAVVAIGTDLGASVLATMNLKELNIRAKLGVNIIAVDSGTEVNVSPSADYVIRKDDIMVVLGDYDSLAVVQRL